MLPRGGGRAPYFVAVQALAPTGSPQSKVLGATPAGVIAPLLGASARPR
ncbi:hypothetical protein [Massilia oculi]|nr:hypothetical protein [Massilia oculi]